MSRKTKPAHNLGRSLIKDRFGTNNGRKCVDGSLVSRISCLIY